MISCSCVFRCRDCCNSHRCAKESQEQDTRTMYTARPPRPPARGRQRVTQTDRQRTRQRPPARWLVANKAQRAVTRSAYNVQTRTCNVYMYKSHMCVPTVPWDVSACTSVCVCTVDVVGPGRGRAVPRCYLGMGTGRVPAEGRLVDR